MNIMCNEKTRKPLARGNVYQFRGGGNRILIGAVIFRGTDDDDGGIEGVSVKFNRGKGWDKGAFYCCSSVESFWSFDLFANAYDPVSDEAVSKGI